MKQMFSGSQKALLGFVEDISYCFTLRNLLLTLYLLIFISVATLFPYPSLLSLVEEERLEAGLEV